MAKDKFERHKQPWTGEEAGQLKTLASKGQGLKQIAKALNRSEESTKDFAKKNEKFEVKTAAFEGNVVDAAMLATLPTYDEAVARLMSAMKEASAGKLVRTIAALRDQKEEAAA